MNEIDAIKAKSWVCDSSNTTEYINKCFLLDALLSLEHFDANCETTSKTYLHSAIYNLRDVIGLKPSGLRKPPSFIGKDDAIVLERLITE